MTKTLDEAIEDAAVCLQFDMRHRMLSTQEISREIHKHLDQRVEVEFELPVTCLVEKWEAHQVGDTLDYEVMNIGGQQAADFINRIAKQKDR
jgi:hypothetical protein